MQSRGSRSKRRCIYCLEEKPGTGFNREHVIPQAFGKFKGFPVLHCVCAECNSYFGEHLDLHLARDSFESVRRARRGLVPRDELRTLGRRAQLVHRIVEGPYAGARATLHPRVDGGVDVVPEPQIGFSRQAGGPFDYFYPDEVPTVNELRERGFKTDAGAFVRSIEMAPEEVRRVLEARGYKEGEADETVVLGDGVSIKCETMGKIGHVLFRAVAKIAFNYLAATAGAGTALMDHFNAVRRYVRHDERPAQRLVTVDNEPVLHGEPVSGRRIVGHIVTVAWKREPEVVQSIVSLFNDIRYVVELSREHFEVVPGIVTGTFFDLAGKGTIELRPGRTVVLDERIPGGESMLVVGARPRVGRASQKLWPPSKPRSRRPHR